MAARSLFNQKFQAQLNAEDEKGEMFAGAAAQRWWWENPTESEVPVHVEYDSDGKSVLLCGREDLSRRN